MKFFTQKLFGLAAVVLALESSSVYAQNSLLSMSKRLSEQFSTTDPLLTKPYIDIDEQRSIPSPHRYVHGGFEGTGTRFSFYFPSKEQYEGRFFQYVTPFPDNENLAQFGTGELNSIGFANESGAYFIETNGGGPTDFSNPMANDATIGAYRANAASAQFSRIVAQEIFGGGRPYGYAFGGSGGAYRTIGGFENTKGVWDGVVPFVLGSPMAIPNVFTARMQAMRVLKDKFDQINDAMDAGGSGDMYAGLTDQEKTALEEVTKMGFPPNSWYDYKNMGIHGFLVLYNGVVMADNAYFTQDFWNKPGYLGYDHPEYFEGARLQKDSKLLKPIAIDEAVQLGIKQPISDADRGSADLAWKAAGGSGAGVPVAFEITDLLPEIDFLGGDLFINSGEAKGQRLQVETITGNKVVLAPTNSAEILAKIKPGDEVRVDNSNFLAVQSYHRHQVPGPEYKVWDQFRDKDGKPIYPQRPMLLGPMFTMGAAGSLPTGKFEGKMILLGSLMDREAFPWQCDWYRSRVKEHLGDKADKNFRLWYTEHALHGDQQDQLGDPTRAVGYIGVLHQALRDLSSWVEKGISPAASTQYEIVDGQVITPKLAQERKGIQQTVSLTVGGMKKVEVKAGEKVKLQAVVEVPAGMGKIVQIDWDFDANENYYPETRILKKFKEKLVIKKSHVFDKSGTYFVTVRVKANRNGNPDSHFAKIQNLDRVRVIVK
ncbi:hypothetical protein TK44_18445 [Jiulongibacter sediminis]|nr:hypothetical protein TK44_18445 [Jiulongibacter sediminis]